MAEILTPTEEIKQEVDDQLTEIKSLVASTGVRLDTFFLLLQEMALEGYEGYIDAIDLEGLQAFGWGGYLNNTFSSVKAPSKRSLTPNFGEAPSAPSLSPIPYTVRPVVPGTLPVKPVLAKIDRPSPLAPRTFTPPVLVFPTVPDAPDTTLPADPTLITITVPDIPALPDIPDFTAVAPVFSIPFPDIHLEYEEPEYNVWHGEFNEDAAAVAADFKAMLRSTLNAAFPTLDLFADLDLDTQISNMAKTGLSGLPPDVEEALFRRAMVTVADESRRNLVDVDDEYSASGYSMPPGAHRAKRDRIRYDLQERVEAFKRDFIAKQTDLIQKYSQYFTDLVLRAEDSDRAFFNNVMSRQLQVAIAAYETAVAYYNVRVAAFNAELAAYRTQAEVYEIRIRASLTILERFRLLIEAEKLKGDVNQQYIQLYATQVEAITNAVRAYAAEVDATKVAAEIEGLRMEGFRTEVQAYGAEVDAKRGEYDGYRTVVQAEGQKVDIFRAEVEAYRADIEGQAAVTRADGVAISAHADTQRLKVDAHRAETQAYTARVAANEAYIRKYLGEYQVDADIYRAKIQEAEARSKVAIEGVRLDATQAYNEAKINTDRLLAQLTGMREWFENQGRLTIAGTDAATRIATATVSQMNLVTEMSANFQTIE